MFLTFKHGGHAMAKGAAESPAAASLRAAQVVVTPSETGEEFDQDNMTPFRYLLDEVGAGDLLPVGEATVRALDKLGDAMLEQQPADADGNSDIPAIYTYWSQFIDHELTARTDRDGNVTDITVDAPQLTPIDRGRVEHNLLNRRTPAIELDCVYGDGPPGSYGDKARRASGRSLRLAKKLRDGAKMRVGNAMVVNDDETGLPAGPVPPLANDLARDLPRIGTLLDLGVVHEDDFPDDLRNSATFRQRGFIGDPRNDENLVVAQFHLAILRFHNAVVDWLRFKDPGRDHRGEYELFEDARKIVRWTHQWLVVNDFLKTLLKPSVVDAVLHDGAATYRRKRRHVGEPFMPIEFSVACYRFGHSMIRNGYDFNRNFGVKPDGSPGFRRAFASLSLLFLFTGKASSPFAGGTQVLPHNWIIEWDRFDGSNSTPGRSARKIDTHLAPTLLDLPNEGEQPPDLDDRIKKLLKQLARRNLRRGYQLSLPTGQAMAQAFGVPALSQVEIGQNAGPDLTQALAEGGFLERTPLWYYILKEAEVKEGGQHLGDLGSRIVAETVLGVLFSDPHSYLSERPHWDPTKHVPGAGGPLQLTGGRTIQKIGDLLEFAGVKPPAA